MRVSQRRNRKKEGGLIEKNIRGHKRRPFRQKVVPHGSGHSPRLAGAVLGLLARHFGSQQLSGLLGYPPSGNQGLVRPT